MRSNSTITQGVIDSALSSQRNLNARVWIRDDRMYFSEWAYGYSGDAPIGDGYEHHAMALSGDRIYRVVAKIVGDEWRLYTQRV